MGSLTKLPCMNAAVPVRAGVQGSGEGPGSSSEDLGGWKGHGGGGGETGMERGRTTSRALLCQILNFVSGQKARQRVLQNSLESLIAGISPEETSRACHRAAGLGCKPLNSTVLNSV